jgi:hypothetical protein
MSIATTEISTAERFAADVAEHEMTVLHDDGLYRHLQFIRVAPNPKTGIPERSSFYWFDLVTWPGSLVINGDMGGFMFSRIEDMFEFFRTGRSYGINPQYWAEKLPAGMRVKEYSFERFAQLVAEHIEDAARELPGLAEDVQAELLDHDHSGHETGAYQLLADYQYYADPTRRYACAAEPDFEFYDTWEWDLTDWSYQFLWCCHAIVWGIGRYDGNTAPAIQTVAVAGGAL